MYPRTGLAAAVLAAATFCGCDNVMTYDEIDRIWRETGAADAPVPRSRWHYTGSDDRCHYFVCRKLSEDSTSFAVGEPAIKAPTLTSEMLVEFLVGESEIVVEGAFPPTLTRSEWKRIDVRMESSQASADVHFPRTLNFAERRRGTQPWR